MMLYCTTTRKHLLAMQKVPCGTPQPPRTPIGKELQPGVPDAIFGKNRLPQNGGLLAVHGILDFFNRLAL